MTTCAQLIDRCRSNLNEPAGNAEPMRSDSEIAQWLDDAVRDYISKIPADAVPELVVHATFSGEYWQITTDFVKLLHVIIDHGVTPSGATTSTTLVEQCKPLDIDEEYFALNAPSWAGSWCKFDRVQTSTISDTNAHVIKAGPACYSGTVTYIGIPSSITVVNTTTGITYNASFHLTAQHEEPVVNYATSMALAKINDEDAPVYMDKYNQRVMAENGMKYTTKRKVERKEPKEID
jgi:hypothetical protein